MRRSVAQIRARDGTLLYQSIYCVDGHVLTRDERRQALDKAGGQ